MSECLDLIEGYEELRLRAYEELHADAVRRFRELADSVPAIKDVVEGYLSRFNDVVDVRLTAPRPEGRGFCALWGFPHLLRHPHGHGITIQPLPPALGRCGLFAR